MPTGGTPMPGDDVCFAAAGGGGTDVGFERCGGIGGGELVDPLRVGIGGGIVGDFAPDVRPDALGAGMLPDAFVGCAIGTAPVRFVATGWCVGEAVRPEAFGGCAIGTAPVRLVATGWLVGEPARVGSEAPGGGATDFGGGTARPEARATAADPEVPAAVAPDGPPPIRDGIASSIGSVGSSFAAFVAMIFSSSALRSGEPGGGGGTVRCFLRGVGAGSSANIAVAGSAGSVAGFAVASADVGCAVA